MLFELILFVVGTIALFTVGLLINSVIRCQLAYLKFKKDSKGLPIAKDRRLIGNHKITWLLRERLCTELLEAHKKHGKVIGWVLNYDPAVSCTDLDIIKTIIYDEPNKHMDRYEVGFPLYEFEQSIMLAKHDKWPRLRRGFAPALKSNKFKTPNVMHEIERTIDKLVNFIDSKLDDIKNKNNHKFQIDDLIHRYSLNLVFSCFYKQYNLINFDDNECAWTNLVDEGLEGVQSNPLVRAAMVFPILRSIIDWLIFNFHPQGTWRRDIMHFVKRQTKLGIEAREYAEELKKKQAAGDKVDMDNFVLKDGTKFSRNIIDHVIDQFLDGKLTKEEYFYTSCFLVGAADKTAADCLVHTLYQIALDQELQDKLRQSIRDHGSDSEYLAWVLNESLRLMPPAPTGCSRTVTREIKLANGNVIPANTLVVTPAYVIHRLKEYWGEDADEFKPERWQDTSNHHPLQYIPFGAGPRGCPGKEFALFEMKLVLSALMTRYKFECKIKEDLHVFNSPCLIFLIPDTPTYITFTKLSST